MTIKKALIVFGTRPEAIKMAPLVLELKKHTTIIESKVCVSGQHRGMLDQVLEIFDIEPDFDLDIMKPNQDLYDITEKILKGMKEVLSEYKPDVVFVHGDTTTAFVSALCAFYRKIPIAHIEAGLRSNDLYSPWPEEGNRKLISQLATYNFAPTFRSKQNLLSEKINIDSITITGNTGIDALFFVLEKIKNDLIYKKRLEEEITEVYKNFLSSKKYVLITGHRRENFGEGFVHICQSIRCLAYRYPNIDFVYPVHLNPNVQEPVFELLNGIENIYLIQPMEYEAFVYLMSKSYIILTDSGGIQEEAPSLGKPVIVMRENTERLETLELGTVKLVGNVKEKIIKEVSDLFDNREYYEEMSRCFSPYGDGTAVEKIIKVILNTL